MIRRLALTLLSIPTLLAAQTQREYAQRRLDLAQHLPDGVFVAFGSHDPVQDYLSFEQAPSFTYLTGFREPEAALVMIKEKGAIDYATMFVQPRQPKAEVFTGARLGTEGIRNLTGIHGRPSSDLFKVLDSLANTGRPLLVLGEVTEHSADEGVSATALTPDEQFVDRIRKKHPTLKILQVNDLVEQMRAVKSATELTLIRNAVDITARALKQVIPTIKPGQNEFELQALIEYTFRRNGADRPSFSTIVGSGPNSTTLHYSRNDRFIGSSDLVVMDVGASFKGYAADLTRTVPASGVFSTEQRAIYQLVRDAQKAAERQVTVGAAAHLMTDSSNAVLANGLTRLGLIESPEATYDCTVGVQPRQCLQLQMYYMHGLGHGIGLEVHDPEQYFYSGRIQPGSAFTIEPGVYIREHVLEEMPDTPRNKAIANRLRTAVTTYKNIGVRIEDDYIVSTTGVEWLSQVPREIAEIEAMMKAGSPGIAPRDDMRVDKYRTVP